MAAINVEELPDITVTPSSDTTSLPTRLGMVKATTGTRLRASSVIVWVAPSTALTVRRIPTMPVAPFTCCTLTSGPFNVNVALTDHGSDTVPAAMRWEAVEPLSVRYSRPGRSADV